MQPSETRREFTNDEATDFTAILTKIKPRTPDAGVQLYAPYSYDAATALIEGISWLGMLTALVGGPFFFWLLRRTRKRSGGWG